MLRLLLAAAAARASNRGHEVAQFVRARAGLLKSIVLFRTHVDDALTVRIYRTLHASLKNAKNYDLHILYDPDALPTCCTQFDEDASSIKFGLQEFEENYPNVGLQMHKGLPALKKSHYQQLAYAFALRGKDYEYAWCVEHDVALTGGNWLGFYEAHASDSRDLLAWRVGWVPKDAKPHKGGAWNAGMMKGPRFDCFHNDRGGWPFSTCHGGHSEVAILFGAIVRYSSRFAALLDQDGAADPPSFGPVHESNCRGSSSPSLRHDLDAIDAKPARLTVDFCTGTATPRRPCRLSAILPIGVPWAISVQAGSVSTGVEIEFRAPRAIDAMLSP